MAKRKSELDNIVTFVLDQRSRVKSFRQWNSRLASFGFSIENTGDGPMIAILPKRLVLCPLPHEGIRAFGA